MPPLSSLLEVQELDLASDQRSARRRSLPEREALQQCQARALSLDAAYALLIERREGLRLGEHALAAEVAALASKVKTVDDTLYSGTVRVSKDLLALQEEIRLLRGKQSGLEEREMELLEEIDQTESEMAENRAGRSRSDAEADGLRMAIRKAEGEIDSELAQLAEQRARKAASVPSVILSEYERLRGQQRMLGRAAAPLAEGSCGGCRIKLPVHEYNRMKAMPDDALLCCTRCGRVLVR